MPMRLPKRYLPSTRMNNKYQENQLQNLSPKIAEISPVMTVTHKTVNTKVDENHISPSTAIDLAASRFVRTA